jgi:hypothetical protein
MASKNYEVTDLGTSSMLRRAPITDRGERMLIFERTAQGRAKRRACGNRHRRGEPVLERSLTRWGLR